MGKIITKQPNYKKFIILSHPRTGSNYLSLLLHQNPHIKSFGEIFEQKRIYTKPVNSSFEANRIILAFRNRFPILFLKTLIFKHYPPEIKAVGFRFFYEQVLSEKFEQVIEFLKNENVKIIHLTRKNLLRNYISYIVAQKTNLWSPDLYLKRPLTRLAINPEESINYFKRIENQKNILLQKLKGNNIHHIEYETLIHSPINSVRGIFSFLHIRYDGPIKPGALPNAYPLKKIITNYAELKEKLSNTAWKSFIYNDTTE